MSPAEDDRQAADRLTAERIERARKAAAAAEAARKARSK